MKELTAKDVLLSTKDKLLEFDKKLKRLSGLTCIKYDKNIERVRYVLHTLSYYKKPEIHYVVKWNSKRLKGMWNDFLVKKGLYVYGRESGLVLRDNSGNSYLHSDEYELYVPNEDQEEFGAILDELLNDEFTLKFLNKEIEYSSMNNLLRGSAHLHSQEIVLTGHLVDSQFSHYLFDYGTDNDKACFRYLGNGILTNEMLEEILYSPLDLDKVSPYQREYIEASQERNKKIIVPSFREMTSPYETSGMVPFKVVEDEKTLRLVQERTLKK